MFIRELAGELALPSPVGWREVQQKWLQLYSTYTAIAVALQQGSATPSTCRLYRQLQLAEQRQLSLTSSGDKPSGVGAGTCSDAAADSASSYASARRRSPEFLWSIDITRRFIQLRADRHAEIQVKGHTTVYKELLHDLGIDHRVTVMMARKKWNYLINRYQVGYTVMMARKKWNYLINRYQVRYTVMMARKKWNYLINRYQVRYTVVMARKKLNYLINRYQVCYTIMMARQKWNYLINRYKMRYTIMMDRKKWNYLINRCQVRYTFMMARKKWNYLINRRQVRYTIMMKTMKKWNYLINRFQVGYTVMMAKKKWNNLINQYQVRYTFIISSK